MKTQITLFHCEISEFRQSTEKMTASLMSQDDPGSSLLAPLLHDAILPRQNMEGVNV